MKAFYTGLQDIFQYYCDNHSIKVVLLDGADVLAEDSTINTVLTLEPLTSEGYARQTISVGGWGIDTILKAVKSTLVSAQFTAASLPIQFDGIGILSDGAATANKAVTSISGSPSTFTINGHGLSSGDKVFFSDASSYPLDLVAGQLYYVISSGLTANTFRLSATLGGSAISVGSSWVGDLVCRYANGKMLFIELRADDGSGNRTFTIQPGQTHTVRVQLGDRIAML